MKIKRVILLNSILLLLKTPSALACAACAGKGFPQKTITAYVNATVFLAASPFVAAGVLGFVAWKLLRRN
jgi:hypothetical protein